MRLGHCMKYLENPAIPPLNELTIDEYENLAVRTNQYAIKADFALDNIMLGFFGEAGSLLSVVKKKTRDDISSARYMRAVEEELGDFLWYYSLVCHLSGIKLSDIAQQSANRSVKKPSSEVRFADVQEQFARSRKTEISRLIRLLISLAGEVGDFTGFYARNRTTHTKTQVTGYLVPIMKSLLRAASAAGIELQSAAVDNLYKTYDRWPHGKKVYPELLDADHKDTTELLPRNLKIRIEQRIKRGKRYVFQSCNGINIGDPLTDKIRDEDYYRFHDVFHYAYAAKLGWSPVTRALFKLKRKSDPATDEAEDGARAILIEEGLAAMIFNYAKDMHIFEGVKAGELSFDLLKLVRDFVSGYEVERMPLWLWEEAILEGFACFRFLKNKRAGIVSLDLDKHSISVKELL